MPAIKISEATRVSPRVDDMLPLARPSVANAYYAQAGGLAGLAGRAQLSSDYAAGTTILNVSGLPKNLGSGMGWIVIDPYTNECEFKKIASVTGSQVTVSALAYNHNADDPVIFTEFPAVNVKWFGAKGDGGTDDTLAIQRAFDVRLAEFANIYYGTTVLFPPGNYIVNSPLSLCNREGMKITGTGVNWGSTRINGKCTNKTIIEMIGAQDISIYDIMLWGDQTNMPKYGFWTGRSDVNVNGSGIHFDHVYVTGYFSVACWKNSGSESNQWDKCGTYVYNASCIAGIMFDYRNALGGITPDNATLTTIYDNVLCRINDSWLTCGGTATGYSPIYVYADNAPYIDHSYLVSYGAPIIFARGGCGSLVLDDISVEGTPTHLIHITDDGTYNVPGKVTRMRLPRVWTSSVTFSSGYTILAETNVVVRDSIFDDCVFKDNLSFWDLQGCQFRKFGGYDTGSNPTLTVTHEAVNCYFKVMNQDTLSLATGYNVIVDNDAGAAPSGGFFQPVNKGLRIDNIYGAAKTASIYRVLTDTASWSPGSISDGAAVNTYIAITGVQNDYTWVCWASYSGIVDNGWLLTAQAYDGGVRVSLENRTGGSKTPTGTLRVVAMKVG